MAGVTPGGCRYSCKRSAWGRSRNSTAGGEPCSGSRQYRTSRTCEGQPLGFHTAELASLTTRMKSIRAAINDSVVPPMPVSPGPACVACTASKVEKTHITKHQYVHRRDSVVGQQGIYESRSQVLWDLARLDDVSVRSGWTEHAEESQRSSATNHTQGQEDGSDSVSGGATKRRLRC